MPHLAPPKLQTPPAARPSTDNLHTPIDLYTPSPASPSTTNAYYPLTPAHHPPAMPAAETFEMHPAASTRSPPPPFDASLTPPPTFPAAPAPPAPTSPAPKTPYTPSAPCGPNGGVHAPGQISHPAQQPARGYTHGLFSCSSPLLCALGCCCPCVLYSRTHHRLKTVPRSTLAGFAACNGVCVGYCVCLPVAWVAALLQRVRIRENYRIAGGGVGDCCVSCWCTGCVLVQDEREVVRREEERRRVEGPGGGGVGGEGEGYRKVGGMVYA